MLRDQDITVPRGDSRRVEWDIDDVTGENAGSPTNLLGKGVRWDLYRDGRSVEPYYTLSDEDNRLRIDNGEAGIVSLDLGTEQTTLDIRNGRYYLRVTEGDEQWTVATGAYSIIR